MGGVVSANSLAFSVAENASSAVPDRLSVSPWSSSAVALVTTHFASVALAYWGTGKAYE